jgi:hypothetical protein
MRIFQDKVDQRISSWPNLIQDIPQESYRVIFLDFMAGFEGEGF